MDINRPYSVFRNNLLMARHITRAGALKQARKLVGTVLVYRDQSLIYQRDS